MDPFREAREKYEVWFGEPMPEGWNIDSVSHSISGERRRVVVTLVSEKVADPWVLIAREEHSMTREAWVS